MGITGLIPFLERSTENIHIKDLKGKGRTSLILKLTKFERKISQI